MDGPELLSLIKLRRGFNFDDRIIILVTKLRTWWCLIFWTRNWSFDTGSRKLVPNISNNWNFDTDYIIVGTGPEYIDNNLKFWTGPSTSQQRSAIVAVCLLTPVQPWPACMPGAPHNGKMDRRAGMQANAATAQAGRLQSGAQSVHSDAGRACILHAYCIPIIIQWPAFGCRHCSLGLQ